MPQKTKTEGNSGKKSMSRPGNKPKKS